MTTSSSTTLRVLSWNIAGRTGRRADEQIAALAACEPDIVALQEVRAGALEAWTKGLKQMGLCHIAETTDLASRYDRTYGVLIASRWPQLRVPPDQWSVPQPERILAVRVDTDPWGPIEVTTVHVPPGATYHWQKIATFEGLAGRLACASPSPRILCGDLNAPQAERESGEVITWGQDIAGNGRASVWGRWHGDTGTRWDAGERGVLCRLADHDLPDVYRALHGYQARGYSYIKGGAKVRYDHLFAARALNPTHCTYRNDWRRQKLSDHAAIEAVFAPNG